MFIVRRIKDCVGNIQSVVPSLVPVDMYPIVVTSLATRGAAVMAGVGAGALISNAPAHRPKSIGSSV